MERGMCLYPNCFLHGRASGVFPASAVQVFLVRKACGVKAVGVKSPRWEFASII